MTKGNSFSWLRICSGSCASSDVKRKLNSNNLIAKKMKKKKRKKNNNKRNRKKNDNEIGSVENNSNSQ